MARYKRPYTDSKHRRAPTHSFRFIIGGKTKLIKTKVRGLRTPFALAVAERHIQSAIDNNGFGDGQNCAGAVCARSHRADIPFKFTGYVDFHTKRAYFSCRNAARDNLPTHCVAAAHNSDIAKLFDTKAGLAKLMTMVRETGPIPVTFYPLPRTTHSNKPVGRRTGERKRAKPRGHKLRVMRALEGGLL